MSEHELMKILRKAKVFTFKEGTRHIKVFKDGKYVTTVPRHGAKEINPITLNTIRKETGLKF